MKCFECGDVGHKRTACPHRQAEGRPEPGPSGPAEERTPIGAPPDEGPSETTAPRGGGAPPAETEAGEGHIGQVDSQAEEQRGGLGREEGKVAAEEPAAAVEDVGEEAAGKSRQQNLTKSGCWFEVPRGANQAPDQPKPDDRPYGETEKGM
ncbi:unnamed protein product [Arctogadus glacialis]